MLVCIAVVHAIMPVWMHDLPMFFSLRMDGSSRSAQSTTRGSRGNPHFVESIRLPTPAPSDRRTGHLRTPLKTIYRQRRMSKDVPLSPGIALPESLASFGFPLPLSLRVRILHRSLLRLHILQFLLVGLPLSEEGIHDPEVEVLEHHWNP